MGYFIGGVGLGRAIGIWLESEGLGDWWDEQNQELDEAFFDWIDENFDSFLDFLGDHVGDFPDIPDHEHYA